MEVPDEFGPLVHGGRVNFGDRFSDSNRRSRGSCSGVGAGLEVWALRISNGKGVISMKTVFSYVLTLALLLPAMVQAAVFPVDVASAATITDVKVDLVAWGVVLIGVVLTIYAFRKIKSIVR